MNQNLSRIVLVLALVLGGLGALYFAHARPGYFTSMEYLGGLLLLEVLVASLWHYERAFFFVLLAAFLWAGTSVPMKGVWTQARWGVLAVGAFAGFLMWMKTRRHHFGAFHLVASFAVLAAVVSALASPYPRVALYKASSLFLLFLYAASGARVAVLGREAKFLSVLLLGCEFTAYATATLYFGLGYAILGNPNSIGALMGVAVAPLLLWGAVATEERGLRQRRCFALLLCAALIFTSLARAGMAAVLVSGFLLLFCLRRYRSIVQAAAVAVCFLAFLGVLSPDTFNKLTNSVTSAVLYKGESKGGVLGSRQTPWQQTFTTIREHPWFGSGFGTSLSGADPGLFISKFASAREINREHGSSYLEIAEWVGWLGLIPFALLFLLLARRVAAAFLWLRRTGNPHHPAIPLAMVVLAGLTHAAFEDWLFAVGYYLTVLFWSLAFDLVDLAPVAPVAARRVGIWPFRSPVQATAAMASRR